MKRGVVLPQHEVGFDELAEAATLAVEAGLDSIWVIDHLRGRPDPSRPFLEGWTCLASVAPLVSDVRLGILVTRAGLRPPRLVAAMALTLSRMCSEFVCGIGIGDESVREEQESLGIGYPSRRRRLETARDTIQAVKAHGGSAKVWVGGGSPDVLELAGLADGWNWWGPAAEFGARRSSLGEKPPGYEISWAGSWPKGGEAAVLATQADEVIIATGASNYRERIAQLSGVS